MSNTQEKVNILKAIKSFTLSNFRSWEGENKFEFKNLNLLFGKNSSGKSSIIDALSLLSQSSYLKFHGNRNIKTNLSLGNLVINGHLAELGDLEDLVFKKRTDPREERWHLKNFENSSIAYYKDLFFEFKLDPKLIFNQLKKDPMLKLVKYVYIKYTFSDITGNLVRRSFFIEDYNKKRTLLLDLWRPKKTQVWAFNISNDYSLWKQIWDIETSEGIDFVRFLNREGDKYAALEMDNLKENNQKQNLLSIRSLEAETERQELLLEKEKLQLELSILRQRDQKLSFQFNKTDETLKEMQLTGKSSIKFAKEKEILLNEIYKNKNEEDSLLKQIDDLLRDIKDRENILELTNYSTKNEPEKVLFFEQIEKFSSYNSNHTKNKNLLSANIESFGETWVHDSISKMRHFIRNNYKDDAYYQQRLDPFDMAGECEEVLLNFLQSIVRIGPHRKRPQRTMTASRRHNVDKFNIGVDGSDLYPLLSDKKILSGLNSSLEKVEIPYTISTKRHRGGRWSLILKNKTDVRVDINDVGYGISQVLPLILQSFQKNKLILIEQPELHLHPKLQANLADIFISSSKDNGNSFIIETHSEHIVLRLQRRCREQVKSENVGLHSKDSLADMININVITQDNQRLNSKNKKMEISKKGEFMNVWPEGFFEERFIELGIIDEGD